MTIVESFPSPIKQWYAHLPIFCFDVSYCRLDSEQHLPPKRHEILAKEIAARSKQLAEVGGFMFFQSPDRVGTADFFLIAMDPPSPGNHRNMVVCAYKCKNYDSANVPSVNDEVDKAAHTVDAIKNQPVFSNCNIFAHFVLVYDFPLKCDSRIMKGMEMVQLSRAAACRKTSKFDNLFVFGSK